MQPKNVADRCIFRRFIDPHGLFADYGTGNFNMDKLIFDKK